MPPGPLSSSPDTMSGAIVFRGTRVPLQAFVDCLKAGDTIDDFLDGYPTVTREQVLAVLFGPL
ncbi:DUF433 domain-containing protein [Botrimarina sp.]|uniref:DUF433 domain-containing protein n=1 Tax=Botrimarina sp. TaxID=2795802 RepID=UPI0032EAD028